MKKTKIIEAMLLTSLLGVNLSAYDADLAKKFDETFSQYSQDFLNNSKMLVDANSVMKMLQKKEGFVLLDIRTPAEMRVLGLKTKNTLEIPFDHLFKKENLDRLPKDRPLVIVCHSGSRALQAATALEMIGFKNAKVLYGGIIALAQSDSTKSAPAVK
ncbi:rhodanese-like domain-containing protein [Sulfurovum riftiae]|uniref:Rhodanese domain-containing protein n=1 Tax=Sulfurovum riftiae TaxID=1630136 RepID=A0A151CJN6_9BACT|nr:rhodanese-like domain-containing protein [Sulfurovum riftiae]KYJ87707.1 hypothetical protein AS592_11485 [Sulfurovum riftiae]